MGNTGSARASRRGDLPVVRRSDLSSASSAGHRPPPAGPHPAASQPPVRSAPRRPAAALQAPARRPYPTKPQPVAPPRPNPQRAKRVSSRRRSAASLPRAFVDSDEEDSDSNAAENSRTSFPSSRRKAGPEHLDHLDHPELEHLDFLEHADRLEREACTTARAEEEDREEDSRSSSRSSGRKSRKSGTMGSFKGSSRKSSQRRPASPTAASSSASGSSLSSSKKSSSLSRSRSSRHHGASIEVASQSASSGASSSSLRPSPSALALQGALKKAGQDSSSSSKRRSSNNNGSDDNKPSRPAHPLAAMFQQQQQQQQGPGGLALRPVFNPGDFAKLALKKTGGPKVGGGSAPTLVAPEETGMDEVRQKAIEDARRCRTEASRIYPWLCVSGDWVARNKEVLHEANITHILNMAHTVCKNYHEESGEFDYLALDVIDSANESILPFLLEAIMYIEKARTSGGSCFVHCHMGVSRSCTVVIAYMMWKDGVSFDEAFKVVKEKRPVCNPNAGFVAQLMEFGRYVREVPPRPELYRVAPHSAKDPALVLKLCYLTNDLTRPVVARPTELDARGVFVLHDNSDHTCYVWVGPRCEHDEEYVSAAVKWVGWMVDLLPNFKDHNIVHCNEETDGGARQGFWIALGVDAVDADEMDDSDVDQNLGKYDEEYNKPVASPKHMSKANHRSNVYPKDVLRRVAERYTVELYGWIEDEDHQDHWDRLENYDSDDLASETMFVLLVQDLQTTSISRPSDGFSFERAYVWLGSQLEGRINEDASVAKARTFIQSRKIETNSSSIEVIIEHDDGESEDFWNAYEAGY